MIYSSYVRSILEYGLFVHYPRDGRGREKLENIQSKGIRIAMGYRNSTPINVMLAEAKIIKMEDRAGLLARNFRTKISSGNDKEIIAKMSRLDILYARKGNAGPRGSYFTLVESSRSFKIDKGSLEINKQPGIYKTSYWINTNKVDTEIEIGKERQLTLEMKDDEFIKRLKEKYKLNEACGVIFTDASKIKDNENTRIGIVIAEEETTYSISIDNRCSIFTAELLAVEKALGYILDNEWKRDMLILTDRL